VVVFGVPNEEWGQAVKAVIATTHGGELDYEALRGFLEDRLARFKHPREVEYVEELPKSGTGKIERSAVLDRNGPA
jgi:fatty-acyl-CoA synthase